MSKKLDLDIDLDLRRWQPAFDAILNGKPAFCPVCGSSDVENRSACGSDRVGFIIIQCSACGKVGHLSRVIFPESTNIPSL